jgi:outer membrane protein insertion porin family
VADELLLRRGRRGRAGPGRRRDPDLRRSRRSRRSARSWSTAPTISGLDKINEVIDLDRDAILDITKVKANRDKIAELYNQKGYYLATVAWEVKPVNEAEVDVWFTVDERAKIEIRGVDFIGNKQISDDELRNYIATRKGGALSFLSDSGTFNEGDFERDLVIISAHYWDKGYAAVKIGTPRLQLSRDKKYMYVAIPIDEGPVFTYSTDQVQGLADRRRGAAPQEAHRSKDGDQFSRSMPRRRQGAAENYYMDQGYAYASVSPMTIPNMKDNTIELVWEIESGKKAYFERINVRGNSKTRDKVIRREMKISRGRAVLGSRTSRSPSAASPRSASSSGSRCRPSKGSSDELVEVNVEVAERPTGTFQIGAGFSSVENFIAQAQISQNNLFGRGQTLALQAQLSSLRQQFLLRFVEPYFLDTNWTVRVRPVQPEPRVQQLLAQRRPASA